MSTSPLVLTVPAITFSAFESLISPFSLLRSVTVCESTLPEMSMSFAADTSSLVPAESEPWATIAPLESMFSVSVAVTPEPFSTSTPAGSPSFIPSSAWSLLRVARTVVSSVTFLPDTAPFTATYSPPDIVTPSFASVPVAVTDPASTCEDILPSIVTFLPDTDASALSALPSKPTFTLLAVSSAPPVALRTTFSAAATAPPMLTLPTASMVTSPVAVIVAVLATLTYSPDLIDTSPSTASTSSPTDTRPAAVALTDLPCRSLPEATDICLCPSTISAPSFASVLNVMSPLALTASFTRMFPSVTTSTSPAWFASPPPTMMSAASPPPPNVTLMSSSTSANCVMSILTLPSPTSSMSTSLPAPTFSALTFESFAPDSMSTDLPASARSPPVIISAPFATETMASDARSVGSGIAVPPSIASLMDDSFSSPAAATPKRPPTLTFAPFMNDTPAGLNIHRDPLAFNCPAILEASVPPTTL